MIISEESNHGRSRDLVAGYKLLAELNRFNTNLSICFCFSNGVYGPVKDQFVIF